MTQQTAKEGQDTMEATELQIKAPGAEGDYLVLRWWAQLKERGELLDVFAEHAATPSGFLTIFNHPNTVLFYKDDEQGVAEAIWFEPFMGSVALGLWCRPDHRHRKYWADLTAAFRMVFQHVPMVMFITKQHHVVQAARDYGFTVVGEMPYLYRGEPGFIAYMTREEFEKTHG